jgi:ankyrin repeat protein
MKKLLLTALIAITYSMSYGMHTTEATKKMFATLRAGNYSLNDISSLLDAKANPNALDQDQFTPLYYAVHHDDRRLIAFLCTHGADPNQVIPGLDYLNKKN